MAGVLAERAAGEAGLAETLWEQVRGCRWDTSTIAADRILRGYNRRQNGTSDDAEMDSLLNERRALDSSRSMTNSIIECVVRVDCLHDCVGPHQLTRVWRHALRQALETKNSLDNQRSRFTHSHAKMNNVSNSFAGINAIVAQIRRKKMRNNTILALVVAGCVCFTLWWVVLSKT